MCLWKIGVKLIISALCLDGAQFISFQYSFLVLFLACFAIPSGLFCIFARLNRNGMSAKIGFDNDKYISMQSSHIAERIEKFGNKLYLEIGGKLFDDYHASRVLPGFQPDSKLQMLLKLKDKIEIEGVEDFVADANVVESTVANDVIDALVELGYSKSEALATVKRIDLSEEMSEEDILKKALIELS